MFHASSSTSRATRWSAMLSVALLPLLGGCFGQSVSGKFIEGPSSLVVVADEKDKRFESPGLAGVEVEIQARSGAGATRVATRTVTDAAGRFDVSLPREFNPADLELIATLKGFVPARGRVSAKSDGKAVLGLMKKSVVP